MWGCILVINKTRGERSLWQWFKESRQSELVVVFGEDLAAQLGLMFALALISLTMITGNPIYDAIGSIMIGLLLIIVVILIDKEVKDLPVGQGVDTYIDKKCASSLPLNPILLRFTTCLPYSLVMVAIKSKMTKELSGSEQIKAINSVEAALKQQFPQIMWLFFRT